MDSSGEFGIKIVRSMWDRGSRSTINSVFLNSREKEAKVLDVGCCVDTVHIN